MRWWWLVLILAVAVGVVPWLGRDGRDRTSNVPGREVVRPTDPVADEPPVSAAGLEWGERFFDQSSSWVRNLGPAVDSVQSFHLRCWGSLAFGERQGMGELDVWYRSPHAYRQDLMTDRGVRSCILADRQGWTVGPERGAEHLNTLRSGLERLRWIHEDRDRYLDLVSFVTLEPLKGPDIRFHFDGYKRGSGTYAGNWIKVSRRAPEGRRITLWFAYEVTSETEVRVLWPGIVRIEAGTFMEDWILKEWDAPLGEHGAERRVPRRVPRRIEAYAVEKAEGGRTVPRRFLFAIVDDLQISGPADDALFSPPREEDADGGG